MISRKREGGSEKVEPLSSPREGGAVVSFKWHGMVWHPVAPLAWGDEGISWDEGGMRADDFFTT